MRMGGGGLICFSVRTHLQIQAYSAGTFCLALDQRLMVLRSPSGLSCSMTVSSNATQGEGSGTAGHHRGPSTVQGHFSERARLAFICCLTEAPSPLNSAGVPSG